MLDIRADHPLNPILASRVCVLCGIIITITIIAYMSKRAMRNTFLDESHSRENDEDPPSKLWKHSETSLRPYTSM